MVLDDARASTPFKEGWEKHAYRMVLPDGTRSDALEDVFEKHFETPAAPLFDKLIADKALEAADREIFASFLGLMFVRTDGFRHRWAQTQLAREQQKQRLVATSDSMFHAYMQKFEADMRPLSDAEKDEIRHAWLHPEGHDLSVNKGWTLRALVEIEKAAPQLHAMQWSVMSASSDSYFITGDDPVVCTLSPKNDLPFGPSLGNPYVQVTFPLSPKACLLASWDENAPRRINLPSDGVRHCNTWRAIHATRELYGPREDEAVRQLARQYRDARPNSAVDLDEGDELSRVFLHRGNEEPA